MALDDKALQAVLGNTSLVNQPAQMQGAGLTGPRDVVPVAEQRSRREALSTMLAAGVSKDKILQTMGAATRPDGTPGFKMTDRATEVLIIEVYQSWRDEDAVGRPHKKAAAVRRIKRQITRAAGKGAFTAVAQLERTLMMIEGTAEPLKVEVTGTEGVSVAVMNVLNVQTPEQLQALVDGEKLHLKEHGQTTLLRPGTTPARVIDARTETDDG